MYDQVYDRMEYAGVAVRLEEPIWVDKNQQPASEENAFGRKVTHLLTRPDMVVFVDEVGSNTSQEGDGAIGGELKICAKGLVPRESATTNNHHFTVLGFTAATGEAIMCAIIVSGKSLKPEVVTGIDVFSEKIGDESDFDFTEKNSGPGKRYPYGPTCLFNGKDVPCIICNSESGSVTSELLVEFLKKMDDLDLFPRHDGVKPFLLLDGHNSRFELPFLWYVNHPNHNWVVCIGVPYGTSYWQVGDSSEQNGSYKIAMTREKRQLVMKKQRMGFQYARMETYEIVSVVNAAWNSSFARSSYNKDAIAARGWGPLTRNLLDNDEIAATRDPRAREESETSTEEPESIVAESRQTIASTLNYSSGLASTLIGDILQSIDINIVRDQIRENRQGSERAANALVDAKKLSAGVLFKSGSVYLGPDVLQAAMERRNRAIQKQREQQERLAAEKMKKKEAYEKTLQDTASKEPTLWTTAQLRSLISYKKRKTDKWSMPKTKKDLLDKWEQIKNRVDEEVEQPNTPQETDDENIIGETDEV
jgi:hypothetical protein